MHYLQDLSLPYHSANIAGKCRADSEEIIDYLIGKGFFDVARNVFQTMQNASRVDKHSNPRSPFRMAVQTKYGLPSSIRREMYKYK